MERPADPPARRPRRMPGPSAERPPLKANIFEKMQIANTQLLPLFPYFGPGAMLPCGALMHGGAGGFGAFGEEAKQFSQFFHYNDADEVTLVWASDGGPRAAGLLLCLGQHHGVKPTLRDPDDPSSFAIMTITQRQTLEGPQGEAITFRCTQCRETLVHWAYDATPLPEADARAADADRHPALRTISGSAEAALEYNRGEQQRTCAKCGTVNAPFPLASWGWDTYTASTRAVNQARRTVDAAARSVPPAAK